MPPVTYDGHCLPLHFPAQHAIGSMQITGQHKGPFFACSHGRSRGS
ncbi:hypothetical protein FEP95_01496 [Burkholderia multivorans]|nr:hypothetical protein [Burkholderia multivorans]MDR8806438.1 hypothetical protein [Burkholderia multivorans]